MPGCQGGRLTLLMSGVVVASACSHQSLDERAVASDSAYLQTQGPWALPPDILAAGDNQYVERDPADATCSGGMTQGALALADYVTRFFPQITEVQGYNCRDVSGSSSPSVHGEGRALDLMLPPVGETSGDADMSPDFLPYTLNDADNTIGDPLANWLVVNAEAIGVQYLVWDRNFWNARLDPGSKTGPHSIPHENHVHVEITEEAGRMETPFFQNLDAAPIGPTPCAPIGPDVTIVDELGPCVDFSDEANVNSQAWRTRSGYGDGGSLRWTQGFQGETDQTVARVTYNLSFEVPGTYQIDVYLDETYATFQSAHYQVNHADAEEIVTLDQTTSSGWVHLGDFAFESGVSYMVEAIDAQPDAEVFRGNGRLVADALRVTPLELNEPPVGLAPDDSSDDEVSDLQGGCEITTPATRSTMWPLGFALILGVFLRWPRRRL